MAKMTDALSSPAWARLDEWREASPADRQRSVIVAWTSGLGEISLSLLECAMGEVLASGNAYSASLDDATTQALASLDADRATRIRAAREQLALLEGSQ